MSTLTKVGIEHRIIRESEELSQDVLLEVLDFILFLKVRHGKLTEPEKTRASMAPTYDISMMLPQHELGKITGILRREEIYTEKIL